MAKLVLDTAQMVMDSFYGSFRPASGFFTLEDFAMRVIDARDNELNKEFLIQFNDKNQYPRINPMWVKHSFEEVKKDDNGQWYADICEPLYEFPLDEKGVGLQAVSPVGGKCAQFIRITTQQDWSLCMMPSTDVVLYSVEKCRVLLHNFLGCCKKIDCLIVPSQSALPLEQQTLPDGMAATIREVVLNQMFRDMQMKLGKISVHDTGNPNPEPNETGQLYEGLKTK